VPTLRDARLFYQVRLWLRSVLRRNRVEHELDEELQFHLDQLVEAELGKGRSPEEARCLALRAMEGLDQKKEACRDMRRTQFIDNSVRDVRYAWRSLLHSPTFFAVAFLSLALGIGANTAVFSLINSLLLRPLSGVPEADRLVRLTNGAFSFPQFEELRARRLFAHTVAVTDDELPVRLGDSTRKANLMLVSGEYYESLGVQPILGRTIRSEDEKSQALVAVLDHDYWLSAFAANPNVIGQSLRIGESVATIIGVTQPQFKGVFVGWRTDITLPITARPKLRPERADIITRRSTSWLNILAAYAPAETFERTKAKFQAAWPSILEASAPPGGPRKIHRDTTLELAANGFSRLRRGFASPLYILMGLVSVLLFAACVNLASLLIARNTARHHEFAIRQSLGAARGRLLQQLLTESMLLSGLASVAGIAIAYAGARYLAMAMSTSSFPIDLDLRPDSRVLAFTAAIAIMSTVLFGLAPAWRGSRMSLAADMKERSRALFGAGRLRRVLVVTEVALAMVMAVGAGLLLSSLRHILAVDLGFTTTNVLLVRADAVGVGYRGSRAAAFFEKLRERVAAVPGVERAGLVWAPPVSQGFGSNGRVSVDGYALSTQGNEAWHNVISPGYLETIGQRLLAGRDFTVQDRAGGPRVAIVNQTMALRFFGRENPLGRRMDTRGGTQFDCEVIGVVRDAIHFDPKEKQQPVYYVPFSQGPDWLERENLILAVRSPLSPDVASRQILQSIQALDRHVLTRIEPLRTHVATSMAHEVILAKLSAFLGALALVLVGIGIYGVMSWSVARRRAEIGVRIALGASTRSVLMMVVREGLFLAVAGVIAGGALAYSFGKVLQSLLFGITPRDVLALGGAVAATTLIALVATLLPAIRASRIDPLVALRYE
jgi:putative ABC transport system permease protein